jgi:LmbE family N-acetylglucosaminyl deacetylase
VIADVVHYIRLLKPQIVITFDPIGGYRHPDHIAIQRATEKAFHAAGDPNFTGDSLPIFTPSRLYFNTMPKTLLKVGVFWMRLSGKDPHKSGKNGDIDLVSIANESFPINAVIDYRSVAEIRDKAAACHASQGGGGQITGGLMNVLRRRFGEHENFMQAYPEPNGHREKDLFEGL